MRIPKLATCSKSYLRQVIILKFPVCIQLASGIWRSFHSIFLSVKHVVSSFIEVSVDFFPQRCTIRSIWRHICHIFQTPAFLSNNLSPQSLCRRENPIPNTVGCAFEEPTFSRHKETSSTAMSFSGWWSCQTYGGWKKSGDHHLGMVLKLC